MIEITANNYEAFQKVCEDFNISEDNAIFIDPKKKKKEERKVARALRQAPERTVTGCSDWVFYSQPNWSKRVR